MILYSIITICKNSLPDLIKTFASLVNQTEKNFEWIVVDGNSTDGTREWLQQNNLVRKWKSEPDQGIYNAMNKGITMASGEYLIFLNSGDELADDSVLSKVANEFQKSNKQLTFVFGDSIDVDEHGNLYYRKAKPAKTIKYGMNTQHQAMFFNRTTIAQLRYPEEYRLSADYALIAKIIMETPPELVKKLNFPVCRFKMGGTNESARYRAIQEDFRIRKTIMKLSTFEARKLHLLHYLHTLVKHTIKRARFFKHKRITNL